MTARQQPRGLGRGLSALIADVEETKPGPQARMIPIERLHPGKYQPRHRFDDAALDALAESLKQQGVLQPLLVRPHPTRKQEFEIVAGERRWRAAQRARLHEMPVLVRAFDDRQTLEVAIVENVQREDLSAIEEAEGYRRLMEEFSHTQDALAASLGKSRSHIANTLRLLGLPQAVKEMIETGDLTAGHARALVTADQPELLAQQVVAKGLSVRETERLAAAKKQAGRPARRRGGDPDVMALERSLSQAIGLKVAIADSPRGGKLTITYRSFDQLDEVIRLLTRE
jgi:ParB family transcriptional regulator, chromosome partitioning protein